MSNKDSVKISFLDPMREPKNGRKQEILLPEKLIILDYLLDQGFDSSQITFFTIVLNGQKVQPEVTLQSGDSLEIILLMGGG